MDNNTRLFGDLVTLELFLFELAKSIFHFTDLVLRTRLLSGSRDLVLRSLNLGFLKARLGFVRLGRLIRH